MATRGRRAGRGSAGRRGGGRDRSSIPAVRRLMAVGAHPDDVEFGCGGVLAREAARGHEVTIVNLSRGEAGTHGTPEEREAEARAAAKRIGARLEFLDLDGDARLEDRPHNAMAIARVIRRLKPHLVLAPIPAENQHPDHFRAGRLARDAARLARYGGLKDLDPLPPHVIDGLYFYDITGASGTAPGPGAVIVDITRVFATWKAAMECHASQMRTRNYLDLQVARARVLGAAIGSEYAMALWPNDPIRIEGAAGLPCTGRRL